MKARLPVLVKDLEVAQWKEVPFTENFLVKGEDVFLDGPVSRRVAAVDFDPKTGRLTPGVRFLAPAKPEGTGRYDVPDPKDPLALDRPETIRVTTFAGVHKTLAMFEEADCLGRRVEWAFKGPQILVVPRAGEWANAYYERESRSLQFFFVTTPNGIIHTCHSQDIIAHETAHAIIDGVAPDLYNAQTPQSLALHEALADITTLLMAFRSRKLADAVLDATGGSLARSSAFSGVAEQLGGYLKKAGRPLRELRHDLKMSSPAVDTSEPHSLSQVMSGALYKVMVDIYEHRRRSVRKGSSAGAPLPATNPSHQPKAAGDEAEGYADSRARTLDGHALWLASEQFKRTVLRALDYLPLGEISFADFARALLACDEASHPDNQPPRDAFIEEFVRRGIAKSAKELEVETNFPVPAVERLDLVELVRSDWLAYAFAAENRKLLGIPTGVPFEVRPRLVLEKTYYHEGRPPEQVRECLFKVTWLVTEPCRLGSDLPAQREIRCGTTLAIDFQTRRVRAVVTNVGGAAAAAGRDAFVGRLLAQGDVAFGAASRGPDGKRLRGVIRGDVAGGTLRLEATARALHMTAERAEVQ